MIEEIGPARKKFIVAEAIVLAWKHLADYRMNISHTAICSTSKSF